MIRASRRLPDFAGVALVDILANGVAMLIIVIVVSIAARVEREERQAEQADEVAAVMSHKFSTSLVLNSLAASPPARLHDYETSPLDQVYAPELLPILELHPGFVREFYSGTIWTRRDLLKGRSGLSAWLAGFTEEQKQRLRVDVYDIAQFYLAMAILREHGIRVHHWHFLTGSLSPGEAARCPPGVAAKDCPGGGADNTPAPLPQLAREERGPGGLGAAGGLGESGASGGSDDSEWPPPGLLPEEGRGSGGAGSTPGLMPGGVVPGIAGLTDGAFGGPGAAGGRGGAGGDPGAAARDRGFGPEPGPDPGSAAALGSFPEAREGRGPAAGGRGGRPPRGGEGPGGEEPGGEAPGREGSGGDGSRLNLRIALPESIRRQVGAGSAGIPALEALFRAMLHYLGELQDSLDAGGTPSGQIAGFAGRMLATLAAPPPITKAEREIARDLALKFALLPHLGGSASRPDPLAIRTLSPEPGEDTVLVIAPNRLTDAVGVSHGGAGEDEGEREDGGEGKVDGERGGAAPGDAEGTALRRMEGKDDGGRGGAERPGHKRVTLALNAYPGIWQGLALRIEPWSVLLMPPEAREPERTRWRAVAYVAPELDDFIVGFVFAGVDAQGRLRVQADANRVRLGGRSLFTEYRDSAFGARGWLVSLYAALVAGLLLLVIARRSLSGRAA